QQPDFGDLDLPLPAPKAPGAPDLGFEPLPALADEGRNPFDELDDLPAPRNVLAEADEVFGELDLPMPRVGEDSSDGFGELDLPLPTSGGSVPPLGDIDLPTPRSDLPALGEGELDLLEPRGAAELPAPLELDLPEPRELSGFGDGGAEL